MPGAAELLHAGGAPASWGNLGLWSGFAGGPPSPTADYASACQALALAVGHAAGLRGGQRVLSLACGAGDELLLWAGHFAAAQVVGVERDPALAAQARHLSRQSPAVQVVCGSALALHEASAAAGPFDAVLCVDAAYHLSPRKQWLQTALARLAPGGRLAYTDLVLHPSADGPPTTATPRAQQALLRGAARLCGLAAAELLPLPAQVQRLQALGAVDVQAQPLDTAVLDGFAHFVQRQARRQHLRPWQAGWRAVATTAALIPVCRRAGLGYAVLVATKPAADAG